MLARPDLETGPGSPGANPAELSAITDRLFVTLQTAVPARMLGKLVHRLARSRRPWLKNALIRSYAALFDIDESEMTAAHCVDYPSWNAFFTRELRPDARPIDPDPDAVCSPTDGAVQRAGAIIDGRMLQAKDMFFTTAKLLGIEPAEAAGFDGGSFATIYLAPHNYHRVHAPLAGTLRQMNFIPGRRYSVNRATADAIPGLFARNERIACRFDGPGGPYWVVFVGAMNVASISTAWCGEVCSGGKPTITHYRHDHTPSFDKGDYIGHFNLGSTVILVFPRGAVSWAGDLEAGSPVRVGRRIGSS